MVNQSEDLQYNDGALLVYLPVSPQNVFLDYVDLKASHLIHSKEMKRRNNNSQLAPTKDPSKQITCKVRWYVPLHVNKKMSLPIYLMDQEFIDLWVTPLR